MIKKGLFLLLLIYIFIGFVLGAYSAVWMAPQADKAKDEFEKKIAPGVNLDEIKKLADELHASKFLVIKINENGEEKVQVQFNRFPGGLSRNTCIISMSNKITTSFQCWHSG